MSHTSGEWRYECWANSNLVKSRDLGMEWLNSSFKLFAGPVIVGEVNSTTHVSGERNYGHPPVESRDEAEANARLITAAPDLLEALERIMGYAHTGASVRDVDPSVQPEFVKARAAINKALGITRPERHPGDASDEIAAEMGECDEG